MELLQLCERAPALVDGSVVVVRLFVEVATTHQAESFAVRSAERRERRRQKKLLAQKRRQIDLEVAADPLGVSGRGVLRIATHDVDRRVVLLGEVRLDR